MPDTNNDNLRFKLRKLQFFESDLKKMENMTESEKNSFANELKERGRYVVIYPDDDE